MKATKCFNKILDDSPYFPDKSLPSDLSLSQLIQVLQQQGLPQGQSVLDFVVKVSTSKSKDSAGNLLPAFL